MTEEHIQFQKGTNPYDLNVFLFITIDFFKSLMNKFSNVTKLSNHKTTPVWSLGKKQLINKLSKLDAYPYIYGPYVPNSTQDDLLEYCHSTTEHYYQSDLVFKTKSNGLVCIIFYHSQKRMLQVYNEHKHNFAVGFDLPYYEYKNGQKTMKTSKLYTCFSTANIFEEIYENIIDTQKHFYEFIHKDKPCYLYFDLDLNKQKVEHTPTNITNEHLLSTFHTLLQQFIQTYYTKIGKKKTPEVNTESMNVIQASNEEKISLHIVYKQIILENNKCLQEVYKQFKQFIHTQEPDWLPLVIDFSVDSSFRMMRICNSCKLIETGEYKRPFKEYKQSLEKLPLYTPFLDSLVTYVPGYIKHPYFNKWYSFIEHEPPKENIVFQQENPEMETPTEHKLVTEKKKVNTHETEFNLDFYRDILDILSPEYYTDHKLWIFVGFSLKNTFYKHTSTVDSNQNDILEQQYYELFRNFSSKWKRYNTEKENVLRFWNSITDKHDNPSTIGSLILHAKRINQKKVTECFQNYFPRKHTIKKEYWDEEEEEEINWYYKQNKLLHTSHITKELLLKVLKCIPFPFLNTSNESLHYINENRKHKVYNVNVHIGFAIHTMNYEWKDIWIDILQHHNLSTEHVNKYWDLFGTLRPCVDYSLLHYLAYRYNREQYELLLTRYPQLILTLNPETYTPDNTIHQRWITQDTYNTITESPNKHIAIKSNMGSGKTHNITLLFTHETPITLNRTGFHLSSGVPTYQTILVITFRRSLANEFYTKWKQYDFSLYSDETSYLLNTDRIIVQIDSLWRIAKQKFDLVILDEVVSTVSHLIEFDKIKHRNECYESLITYIYKANKVIYLDANLSDDLLHVLTNGQQIYKIHNTFKVYTHITVRYHFGKEKFQHFILSELQKGKPIVIASNCKQFLRKLTQSIPKEFTTKLILAKDETSSYSDTEASPEECPTTDWNKYDILMYTPSICAGVSFDELYFQKRYEYLTNDSCDANMSSQMTLRVRHTIEPVIEICFDQTEHDVKPIDADSVDEYLEKKLDSNVQFITKTNDKDSIMYKLDDFYQLYRYVTIQKHISINNFQEKLSSIFSDHGMHLKHYYPEYTQEEQEQIKTIRKENTQKGKDKSKQETNTLVSTPLITEKDYNALLQKSSHSLEDTMKLKKYNLFTLFKLDNTQPNDTLVTNVHYLKTKTRAFRLLHTAYQIGNIKEIIDFCKTKNSTHNVGKIYSPNDTEKLYLNHNWEHIGVIFKLLDRIGFTTLKVNEERVELDWKSILFFLKKRWRVLNEISKIHTNVNELPDTLEDMDEKTQTKVKKCVMMILNTKLNEMICMQLERNSTKTTSKLYNLFSLVFEPQIKDYISE